MVFKEAFLALVPNAEPEKHKYVIETPTYQLFVRVVQDQNQALQLCRNLVEEEKIHGIILCPGFTHKNVAEIAEVVGDNVGVFVARGDDPSSRIVMAVIDKTKNNHPSH